MKKIKTFLKFSIVSILSFLIDISIFTILNSIFKLNVYYSTIIARIISSIFNYEANRRKVFNSTEDRKTTIIKYFILVIIQMFISSFLVDTFTKLFKIDSSIIKTVVDSIIYVVNYFIQKVLIFKK